MGFIYNNTTKYFYIRDITGLILGIALQSGNIVVKYSYDSYGKILSINDTSGISIGTINPFRYKGYYYDNEMGWFWLCSRYYSPELCRFISPDDVDYLDPSSINGLNLYAYCGNDLSIDMIQQDTLGMLFCIFSQLVGVYMVLLKILYGKMLDG